MDKVDIFFEPVRMLLAQLAVLLPRLALAALVVAGGWLLAKAAGFAVVKALRAINFNVLTERSGIDAFLEQGGLHRDMTDILGALTHWMVIVAALIIAFSGLGLTHVTELLREAALILTRVVVALVIVAIGAYFARFISNTVISYCRSVGAQDADLLARLAHHAVLVFTILIALDHLSIGGAIVRESFLILLAGLVLAVALAFGIGGRRWAADLLERWWPTRLESDPQDQARTFRAQHDRGLIDSHVSTVRRSGGQDTGRKG